MTGRKQELEDALIEIWNRLEGMWLHHQDGSDFCPVQPNKVQYKGRTKESIHFDILFNEIAPKIRKTISVSRQKELH